MTDPDTHAAPPSRAQGPARGGADDPSRSRGEPRDAAAEFQRHRPLLLGLAYRMLGSMWDAEDVVQDAWLRWTGADRADVREPRAFLVTVVTRLALDELRSARVKREAYPGTWLPEPVATGPGALGPLDTVELRDTLSYATLHLLERLSPPERAVFVLREAFELPYERIAGIVGLSQGNCRQLHRRAAAHLAGGRERFSASNEERTVLLDRFIVASQGGDLSALTDLLSADVVSWSDGGGVVKTARLPIVGREHVLTFLLRRAAWHRGAPDDGYRLVEANGEPAAWSTTADGAGQLLTVAVRDGRLHGIFTVRAPDKLTRVRPA